MNKINFLQSNIINICLILTLILSTIIGKYVSGIINLLILLISLSFFIYRRKIRVKKIDKIIYTYMIFYLASIILNGNYYTGIKNWLLAFIVLVIIFQKSKFKNISKQLVISYKTFIIISLFTTVLGIYYFIGSKSNIFMGETYGITHYGALTSIYTNPNTFGLVSMISFLLSNILNIVNKNKIYKINMIVQIVGVIFSKSRTSALGIILYITLYYILKKRKKLLKIIIVLAGSVGLIFYSKMILSSKTNSQSNFFNGRIELWIIGIKIGIQNLLGIGTTDKIESIAGEMTKNQILINLIKEAGFHNILIQIFVINGIVGIICFMGIFLSLIKKYSILSKNNLKLEISIYSSCIVILISNMFEGNIFFVSNFMAISFWSLYSILDKNLEEEKNEKYKVNNSNTNI